MLLAALGVGVCDGRLRGEVIALSGVALRQLPTIFKAMTTHQCNALSRLFSVSVLGIPQLTERNVLFHLLFVSCLGIARSSELDASEETFLLGLV